MPYSASRLTLTVNPRKHTLRVSGPIKRLNRPRRFLVERYFNRWGNFMDLRRFPDFERESIMAGLDLAGFEAARKFYREEILRRTVVLEAKLASGVKVKVLARPRGSDLIRRIKNFLAEQVEADSSLLHPLDAFFVEERVKALGGVVEYADSFRKLFPRYMHNRLSCEESGSFYRQIAVRHLSPALSEPVSELVSSYVDKFHLLEEPTKLQEFARRARELGAQVRVTKAAQEISGLHHLREEMLVRGDGDGALSLSDALRRKELRIPLSARLYRFQQRGVAFLFLTHRALLADDMGLGKTLQAIAAALALKQYAGLSRALVVCPASLKLQWEKEIRRFTKENVQVVSGDAKEREFIYESLRRTDAPLFTILNYELTWRDVNQLSDLPWDLIILDEAQRIKNYRTKTYDAIKKLPHRFMFALSGTPLENELDELYNIVRLLNPDVLPANPLVFRERYCEFDPFGKIRGYTRVDEVRRKISALTLRRTKRDTLDELPPVIERPLWLEMESKQRGIYGDIQSGINTALSRKQWRELDVKNVMVELQRLREVCDSPRIHFPEMKPSPKERELLVLLQEQVQERKQQVIVFTQWTRMGDLLAEQMEEAKLPYVYLHGGIEQKKREEMVREFQTGKYAVFLSTDAGGLGLNLQAANLVINFDLPFNPAKLDQRISRAHRLGQTEPVNVINLLMSQTVEENLVRILERRKKLFHEVFSIWEEEQGAEQITLDEYLKDSRRLVKELLSEIQR